MGAIEGITDMATTNCMGGSAGAAAASQVPSSAVVGRSAGGIDLR